MTTWLADPVTRAPLPAFDTDAKYMARVRALMDAAGHWRPGWRQGIERDETGRAVRMWFRQCSDACCK